jgi:chaperonin cofactor prefoldin
MPVNDKIWMDWSHKVLEELTTLNDKLQSMQEKQRDMSENVDDLFQRTDKKLEKLNEILSGNGDPQKGLLIRVDRLEQKDVEDLDVRVDRLEQSESRRIWMMRATIVACLGAIGATIASWYKKP